MEKKNAEDAAKWALGLIFSAGIATFQNWRSKREQQKAFKQQVQEMHAVVTAKPPALPPASPDAPAAPGPPPEDLRTIVQRIQQQLTEHQSRTDERHRNNLDRFENIEERQKQVSADIVDLRVEVRQNRGENRTYLKRILREVRAGKPVSEEESK